MMISNHIKDMATLTSPENKNTRIEAIITRIPMSYTIGSDSLASRLDILMETQDFMRAFTKAANKSGDCVVLVWLRGSSLFFDTERDINYLDWAYTRPASVYDLMEPEQGLPTFPSYDLFDLVGFVDAAHANDLRKRHSTTGYAFILSGAAIAYKSKNSDHHCHQLHRG